MIADRAEIVIVGTGAGGATAARALSEAGRSVLMLEEGELLRPEQRARGLLAALSQSARDMATLSTVGSAPLPLLQGRCVGGSTAINSGIVWRLPEPVRADLAQRYGLSWLLDRSQLERIYTQLEDELEVGEIDPEVRGGNAQRMEEGARALGLAGRTIRRNARRCVGHARCLQGCPEGARQSMDVSYVPRALSHGAKLLTRARAERILFERGRAVGVAGHVIDADGRKLDRFEVRASRAVIVAAGAVFTPMLLRASGLTRRVGDGFQAHPGAAVIGRFREPVSMGFGATQAYEVPLAERRLKLESLSLPPELLAARLPGAGAAWQERLQNLDHFAQWATIVRMQARGRVRRGIFGGPHVRFDPTPQDVGRVQEGVALLARMMLAAGAVEVYPGVAGAPEVITDVSQIDAITSSARTRKDFHLMASHHFATAAAGSDPSRSVVDERLACRDAEGLYVMDASVLPENLGVNPQHTIMAVAFRAAEQLAA